MPAGVPCLLCKAQSTTTDQYRLVQVLQNKEVSFTALGSLLQDILRCNIPCVYPTIVCRKCRDIIIKAERAQHSFHSLVSKLRSMLESSEVLVNQTPSGSPSRPHLQPVKLANKMRKRTLSPGSFTGMSPKQKKGYTETACPLLPALSTCLSHPINVQDLARIFIYSASPLQSSHKHSSKLPRQSSPKHSSNLPLHFQLQLIDPLQNNPQLVQGSDPCLNQYQLSLKQLVQLQLNMCRNHHHKSPHFRQSQHHWILMGS